jgi:hypothetical protein
MTGGHAIAIGVDWAAHVARRRTVRPGRRAGQ